MRRLGAGTGFAGAKPSEVVARSERSLATVRSRGDPCTQVPDFASVVGEERRWDAETWNRYRLRWREAVRGRCA
jgi:hypothetical protein